MLPIECDPGLSSLVPNGYPVYIGQPIAIICRAKGTQVLAWRSDEYIGLGGQLAFGPGDEPGEIVNSEVMTQTFALLTLNTIEDGEPQLESQLHLTVASRYQTFTIICRNVDQDRADNVTYHTSGEHPFQYIRLFIYMQLGFFSLLGDNATQLINSNGLLCPTDDLKLECTARNTSIIELHSNIYNGSIQCRNDSPPMRILNITDVGYVVYSNVTSVLICSLTVKARELPINQQLSFTCLNIDIGVRATASFEVTGVPH